MKLYRVFLLLFLLIVVSCNPSSIELPEIEEGSNFITGFSSVTSGKDIEFKWDYLFSDFGHLDVRFATSDGTIVESFSITDPDQKSYLFHGENDKIYKFSFTPYTSKEVKCREEKDSRLIHEPVLESGLPKLIIETENGVWPTCDLIDHPDGCTGRSIKNNENVKCSVKLEDGSGKILNKKANYNSSECKIRIRGNTSAWLNKKPFKIKLDKKEDLIGLITKEREGSQYEDKNWILLNSSKLLNTAIGFETTKLMGIEFSPAYAFVEVYINGDYRGLYLLVESVKEGNSNESGQKSRCAIDSDGYILEYDSYWWNEDLYLRTETMHRTITFKYPEPEDITEEQFNYIKDYIHLAEVALLSKDDSYLDYFDTTSFVAWTMIHEYLGCADPGGSNQFVIKRDSSQSTKLEMTTAWDFDGIMDESDEDKHAAMNRYDYFLTQRLLEKKVFFDLCKEKYADTRDIIVDYLDSKIDALDETSINTATTYDSWRWGTKWPTVAEAKKQIDDWLTERFDWMDSVYK